MKYEIVVSRDSKVQVLSASCMCEVFSLLNDYKADGYKVLEVANAVRKPRGIFNALVRV